MLSAYSPFFRNTNQSKTGCNSFLGTERLNTALQVDKLLNHYGTSFSRKDETKFTLD